MVGAVEEISSHFSFGAPMVHFFGAHVTEAKAVSFSVPEGFVLNVVHATLASGNAAVLSIETTSLDQSLIKVVVGTLRAKTCDQIKLDLVLGSNKAKLSVSGDGVVHLSGYYQPGPPDVEDEASEINRLSVADLTELIQKAASRVSKADADELDGDEDDDDDDVTPAASTHKKRPRAATPTWDQAEDDDDDDDDEPTAAAAAPKKTLVAPTPKQPSTPQSSSGDSNKKKRKKNKKKKGVLTPQ
ncbi:Aste57867_7535 [Aphanomyces stellatus]|uniref:Aste57867_7535 protein n=1 Tax=Aphanomyces stellatus TaxID=120398 RepID=A0A485KII2_9STRA|nr:hypothetical protein As57867_007509 [Aphanomyces stellatus]VFT84444.1 Aste57867_7535 [Aphanomyces stellatus]